MEDDCSLIVFFLLGRTLGASIVWIVGIVNKILIVYDQFWFLRVRVVSSNFWVICMKFFKYFCVLKGLTHNYGSLCYIL